MASKTVIRHIDLRKGDMQRWRFTFSKHLCRNCADKNKLLVRKILGEKASNHRGSLLKLRKAGQLKKSCTHQRDLKCPVTVVQNSCLLHTNKRNHHQDNIALQTIKRIRSKLESETFPSSGWQRNKDTFSSSIHTIHAHDVLRPLKLL